MTQGARVLRPERCQLRHAHAKMKNRGFGRMLVHGIAKVRVVCLLHALAHDLLQAHRLRTAA